MSLHQDVESRQNSSQEKTESLSLSDDPDHSPSRSNAGLEEMPSPPESAILEERSLRPNYDMALVDSHLPVGSSASTIEEKRTKSIGLYSSSFAIHMA
jgi:hypothetical protein